MPSTRTALVAALVALAAPVSATAAGPTATAASKIVLHGRLERIEGLTAVYFSPRGTYRATWIDVHLYRLTGRIGKRKLHGTFTTRQTSSGKSYTARGTGTLGSRHVRINGSGPNNLRTSRLVLR